MKAIKLACICVAIAQGAYAIDLECKFSGERRPTVYKDLVAGENITFVGKQDDVLTKNEVYWGDNFVTIIVELSGYATLVVVDRNDFSATKRVMRAGISKGEARGVCRILKGSE